MPAKSKAQQRFMGMVHALQKGEIKPSDVSDKVKKAADSMSDKDAEDFASTKHKGLPKKVKEALLRENPAAAAAAAMVMIQMQNPDTGNKVKAITPLRNKDHKLHGKAKGIFKRLKDKFSKKSESVEEGFGGDLKGSDKKKFEKARKENAEQLGYELTGTSDIKESVNEGINDKMKKIMTKLAKSLSIKSVVDMYTGKGSLSYFLDDEKEALKLQKFLQKSFKRVRKINLDKSKGDTANFVVAADMLGLESVNEAGLEMNKLKDAIKIFQKKIKKQGRVTNARDEEHLKNLIKVYKQMGGKGVKEAVIKVSKKDDIPGNPMKMKGEEKIKKLAWSGSVGMKKPGSYEIKGNKLNVNNIRPRDKGFFVRHFTMGTGFRKANLYYDGVHWQGKNKF